MFIYDNNVMFKIKYKKYILLIDYDFYDFNTPWDLWKLLKISLCEHFYIFKIDPKPILLFLNIKNISKM